MEWFSKAGLVEISISINVPESEFRFPKNNLIRPSAMDLLEYGDLTEERMKYFRPIISRMIEEGFIDKKTIEAAEEEATAWLKNPYAFNYWVQVFASGRVVT